VLIGNMPSARITDRALCVSPAPDVVTKGSPTVLIGNCGLSAARMGDSTVHGGLITKGEPTVLIGDSATVFGPGPLTPEQAQELFDIMAAQGDIAYGYPVDGCYARAELMAQRMQQLGLDPGKVWSFAAPGQWMSVATSGPYGVVTWGYHVAATVAVQTASGGVAPMVFDPSMFQGPVSVAAWGGAQQNAALVGTTQLGQSPNGYGSGYWPADDPDNILEDAFDTMREYVKLDPSKAGCR